VETIRPERRFEESEEDWSRGRNSDWNRDRSRDRDEDVTGAGVAARGEAGWALGIVGMGGSAMRRSIVTEGHIPHPDPGKPKFQTKLPGYFFTGVKVI
jgi:hypothetical protein